MPCGVRSYMNQVTPTFLKLNHKLMILEIVYLSKLTSKHRDKAKERKRKRQEKTKENQGHSPKKIWESGLDIVSCFYLDAWTYTDFVLQETSGRYNVFRQSIPAVREGREAWLQPGDGPQRFRNPLSAEGMRHPTIYIFCVHQASCCAVQACYGGSHR